MKNGILFIYAILFLMATAFSGCDDFLGDSNDEESDDSKETIDTEDSRVTAHFPKFGQTVVPIDSVWLEVTDNTLLSSSTLYCEVFQYPLSDSAWFAFEGVQFASGNSAATACSEDYPILYTASKSSNNKIIFSITGCCGCQNPDQSTAISGYNYLAHIFDDENEVKFYWTFTVQ